MKIEKQTTLLPQEDFTITSQKECIKICLELTDVQEIQGQC